MDSEDKAVFGVGCGVLIMAALLFGTGVTVGNNYRDKQWKDACVEQGVAEYSVDNVGRTSWNWKQTKSTLAERQR